MADPYYTDESVVLWHADCLDVLVGMGDNTIDAVVTDPPYELTSGKKGGTGIASISNTPAGRSRIGTGNSRGGFMGKDWDATGIAFDPNTWRQVLRVLKPGGHMLAFGGDRTAHRLVSAIEDAGFEIRHTIAWIYASGFPKSLDVGKAIDKRPGVQQHRAFATHLAERREAAGLSRADISERVVGTRSGACWNWEHHQFPEAKWWPALRDLLSLDPSWGEVVAQADRETIAETELTYGYQRDGQRWDKGYDITAPATDDAKRWHGWGTALKPAHEPITLARKPLQGTVARNVLRWGIGAINVAACQVGVEANAPGRWPPNLLLTHATTPDGQDLCVDGCVDGCPVLELDRQSGVLTSPATYTRSAHAQGTWLHAKPVGSEQIGYGDAGGASRFFPVFRYQAKAPASERPQDWDGSGHPTVKPLQLIRWLARLITPPGGLILDSFAGSGTTGEAAVIEGFRAVLVEQDEASCRRTVRRLTKPIQPVLDLDGGAA